MKSYYRVMLGQGSKFAEKCLEEGFIGADFGYRQDFSNELSNDKNKFIEQFGPEWMERSEKKSKISAGLAAGYTWRISIGIKEGDIILSPDGQGTYLVGEVTQPYNFHSEGPLPHRRSVNWYSQRIGRNEMSEALRKSTGSAGTVSNVTKHSEEIESLIQGKPFSEINNSQDEDESTPEKEFDEAINTYMTKKMDYLIDQLEDNRIKDLLIQINKLKLDHPEVTLNLARKTAELISKRLFKELLNEDPGTRTLDDLILRIAKDRCVPRLISTHLLAIQYYGNFGSHDQGEDNYALRTECVTPCLMAYVSLLDWFIYAGYA